MKFKLISIMAVWDEQNMIALSIESTKDIVFEYIVLIKKGTDKTKEVVEWCKSKWNLNIRIIETDIKLREARKLAVELTKEYADYYLIQDGDEIYFTEEELKYYNAKTITELMIDDYDHCQTTMIYLFYDLLSTRNSLTRILPHPFLLKNKKNIIWPDKGDLPYIKYVEKDSYKLFNSNTYDVTVWESDFDSIYLDEKFPYKFDCNIKNYGRMFKRYVFTAWHDGNNNCTIEDFCYDYHPSCIWYKKNINPNSNLEEIINYFEEKDEEKNWKKFYDEKEYYKYPKIIKKYIDAGKIKGVENIKLINE
jgi:hypothetical protein